MFDSFAPALGTMYIIWVTNFWLGYKTPFLYPILDEAKREERTSSSGSVSQRSISAASAIQSTKSSRFSTLAGRMGTFPRFALDRSKWNLHGPPLLTFGFVQTVVGVSWSNIESSLRFHSRPWAWPPRRRRRRLLRVQLARILCPYTARVEVASCAFVCRTTPNGPIRARVFDMRGPVAAICESPREMGERLVGGESMVNNLFLPHPSRSLATRPVRYSRKDDDGERA